ncbi:hypothetical protein [Neosynechococcus sphagnicola]|uniref:hypothetical protein n=1 Tax=Neosynechococcus sphagnicola TaxID=1501145 RepID=UPI0012E0C3D9|nr:hypothetical protein [Neosynechococcus sphagnicola]
MATIPVLSVAKFSSTWADTLYLFDLVFFVVVAGSVIPGTTVRWVTRKLGLLEPKPSTSA